MFSKKSKIAFIGAGKIAHSLIPAFINAGYNVTSIISRNKNSAKKLAKTYKLNNHSDKLNSLKKEAKVFFLTVPDSEIAKTAETLSEMNFQEALFIHVSGALDINELKSLKESKVYTASLHIMQSFPSKKIVDIRGCSGAIEADRKVVKYFLNRLLLDLGLKPFYLKPEKKIYYHLAGVFASNFLVGNLFNSQKIFKLSNDKADYFTVFNSIIYSTLNNIKSGGPVNALSGPVERGDYETIALHIKSLKKNNSKISNDLFSYLFQSLLLLEIERNKNGSLNEGQKRIEKNIKMELITLKKP